MYDILSDVIDEKICLEYNFSFCYHEKICLEYLFLYDKKP